MLASVIFFVETRSAEQRLLLCRWVEHFVEQRKRVQVAVDSSMAAQQLDALLWTFSQGSFIPHRIFAPSLTDPIRGEVLITTGEILLEGYDALIADAPVSLSFMKRFQWVVHFVLMDETERRQESRLIWQESREQGVQVRHIPYGTKMKLPALT